MYEPGPPPPAFRGCRSISSTRCEPSKASEVLREAFGSGFVEAYVKLRMAHWSDYMRHFTEWSVEHTLDV